MSQRGSIRKVLTLFAAACALAACSGGGGDGGPNTSTGQGAPPAPRFDCTGYFVDLPVNNNWLLLGLPPGRTPPATVSKSTIQEWTACLHRAGGVPDTFEHIFFINGVGSHPANAEYSGTSFLVSNFVQGIGLPQFEEWSAWGVGGNLKSVIHFPSIEDFVIGPKLHELAHAWGVGILEDNENSGWEGHWGFTSANGQLGGFDLDTLRFLGTVGNCSQTFAAARTPILDPANPYFGPNANGGDSLPYGPLELYLMGKLSPDELPADTVIAPGAYFIDNAFLRFCAPSGLLQYPTRSWLEGRHGVRQPNAFNSNFSHKVLFVQVYDFSTENPYANGFLPIDLSCEIYDFTKQGPNSNPVDYNFWEATFGRGVLDAPPSTEICPNCNYLNPAPIDPGTLGPGCGG